MRVDRNRVSELEREVQQLRAKLNDAFSAEEMDAIREQLARRVEEADKAREELEWNIRVELAKVREAEASCLRAANEMREVASSLAGLLGEDREEDTLVAPRPRVLHRRRMFA